MIGYALTTILLSCLSWYIYRLFFHKRMGLQARKQFVYLAIGCSLLLPLFNLSPDHKTGEETLTTQAVAAFGSPIELAHLQQYCNCEFPNYTHRIRYRANALYQLLIDYKAGIFGIILLGFMGVLGRFGIQLIQLAGIVRQARRCEARQLDGISYFLLYPAQKMGVGAFQLRHRYIIWSEEMNELEASAQAAILRHELSHLKQYNTFERIALNLLQCCWWLNPAFYGFRKELGLLSELLADQAAASQMSSRHAYARLLLALKEKQSLPPLAPGLKASEIQIRVRYLMQMSPPTHRLGMPARWSIALFLIAQLGLVPPLSAGVSEGIQALATYEEIYYKLEPGQEEALYCPDCESICWD